MRYPFADLERLMDTMTRDVGRGDHYTPNASAAIRLGLDIPKIRHLRYVGLTSLMADRLAVKAGFHPSMVWPTWFDDVDKERKCPWCLDVVMNAETPYCSTEHHELMRKDRDRDRKRSEAWLRRLDRYRSAIHNKPHDTISCNEREVA